MINIGKIDIPNTTNGLEGVFGHIKAKVSLHRGLKKREKLNLFFLSYIEKCNSFSHPLFTIKPEIVNITKIK